MSKRSSIDIPNISEDSDLSDVVKSLNLLITQYSDFNKRLSFQNNFDGYIAEVVFAIGEEKAIQHFLGVTPKFRVILRQTGNGVLTDVTSGWNNKTITIKNNGSVEVTASILIARE